MNYEVWYDDSEEYAQPLSSLWEAVMEGDAKRAAQLLADEPQLKHVIDDGYEVPWSLPPELLGSPLSAACWHGHKHVASVLLDHGAVVDKRSPTGYTALILAACGGHGETARLLLDHGADPDGLRRTPKEEREEWTSIWDADGGPADLGPLHYAAERGDEQMVGLLLERGATCDLPDFNGNTALHHAGRVDSAEVTRRLMAAGANELLKNKGGETPLEAAGGHERDLHSLEMDGSAAAKVIVDHVARMEEVASDGDYRPWEMNAPEPSWAGEFWGALRAKDTPVAQRMLQENPRLARARHPNGTTALHLAVYDTDLTQEMIARGADVDARDGFGDTALHHAARLSADGAIWHLRRAGIRAYEDNRAGLCPYDISRYTWGGQRHSLLLTDIGDKIDYSALTDVRSSGVMCESCHGAPMSIVPIGGQDTLVCDDPMCQHTAVLTDVGRSRKEG